ncbi:MFS general substrate transporter [Penicillium verhagenii]|uniref:MFS general substrate transporter n=1 Tax=Penicillium verhagenii TaxID=1562060 RepID=UPI0025452DFA|nr:MFS general substrate transporter [Penicillium verhagenii]KAJ5917668.1 MFS general substrate transporter [Penicillium verhagenii]
MSLQGAKSAHSFVDPEHTIDETTPEPKLAEVEAPKPPWTNDAPDGGLTAWLAVLGAWCALFCTFGWINSVGTFQDYYETTLLRQYSSSTIAWIPSLQIFFMFAMGPIIGQLYDRFGPRYIILGGSFLHILGLMMASISKEYYQLLLSQGVCSAMGVCAIFQPSMNVIPSWFDKKRGAAYGIVATGSSLGGVIFPIMVSRLIAEIGYGWAMRVAAFLIMFLLAITALTVRSRVPPRPRKMDKDTLLRPFKEVKMVLLVLGFVFLTFGVFIPIDYVVVQALSAGMSSNLAQYLVSMLNAASLFGRMLAGIFSDKVGHYNILVSACFLAGVLVLALWIPAASNASIIVFACAFGFASGAYVSLAAALVVKISPFPEIGYRTGLLFLFSSIGGLTTNPIAGAILQRDGGSYTGMKIFSGVFLLVGSVLVLAARLHHTGLVWKAKF